MPITRTAMIDDDGSGTTGTILNNAWKQELYNQIDGVAGNFWSPVAFNAANFYASSGVWTVAPSNVAAFHWVRSGQTVTVAFRVTGTMTLTAAATTLVLKVVGSPTPALSYIGNPFSYYMTGAVGTGVAEITPEGFIGLTRDVGGTAFPAFTSAFLIGQLSYPV